MAVEERNCRHMITEFYINIELIREKDTSEVFLTWFGIH